MSRKRAAGAIIFSGFVSSRILFFLVALCFFLTAMPPAVALTFLRPQTDAALVGEVEEIEAAQGDTVARLGQRYNVGVNALLAANPSITRSTIFSRGAKVELPGEFLLPPLPRHGIVVNLPEMRLYYYPDHSDQLMTYPVGIGKVGNTIPVIRTLVTRKVVNPVWVPTPDIRKFNEIRGITLPKVMPAGPDNPLGPYAIYLRIPTYLIHSTIFPESIGTRASFGCIRMHEADIEQFFPGVQPGTPVDIINMPDKIAWQYNTLYLEAHAPLEEHDAGQRVAFASMVKQIEARIPRSYLTLVDWPAVEAISDQPDGIPHAIGVRLRGDVD